MSLADLIGSSLTTYRRDGPRTFSFADARIASGSEDPPGAAPAPSVVVMHLQLAKTPQSEDHTLTHSIAEHAESLKSLRHPYLLEYVGIITHPADAAIVCVSRLLGSVSLPLFLSRGLWQGLQQTGTEQPRPSDYFAASALFTLTSALEHLHLQNPPVHHSHLTADDIFVGTDGIARLAHYGTHALLPPWSDSQPLARSVFAAPECIVSLEHGIQPGYVGPATAIYALAHIIASILSGHTFDHNQKSQAYSPSIKDVPIEPSKDITESAKVYPSLLSQDVGFSLESKRISTLIGLRPNAVPLPWKPLLDLMWAPDPSRRPSLTILSDAAHHAASSFAEYESGTPFRWPDWQQLLAPSQDSNGTDASSTASTDEPLFVPSSLDKFSPWEVACAIGRLSASKRTPLKVLPEKLAVSALQYAVTGKSLLDGFSSNQTPADSESKISNPFWDLLPAPADRLALQKEIETFIVEEKTYASNIRQSYCSAPRKHWLVSGGRDNHVKIWDPNLSEPQRCFQTLSLHSSTVYGICSIPFRAWGKIQATEKDKQQYQYVFASASDDSTLRLYSCSPSSDPKNASTSNKEPTATKFQSIQNTAASGCYLHCLSYMSLPNRRIGLSAGSEKWSGVGLLLKATYQKRAIDVYDISPLRELRSLTGHTEFTCFTMPITDSLFVSGSNDNTVRVWDVETFECTQVLQGHTSQVRCATPTQADPHVVYSGACDHIIRVWDRRTSASTASWRAHTSNVNYLLTGSDALARAFDSSTIPANLRNTDLTNLVISGSDDDTIRIWDRRTSNVLKVINSHTDDVNVLGWYYYNNSIVIASGSDDRSIRLHDTDGKQLLSMTGHTSAVLSIAVI